MHTQTLVQSLVLSYIKFHHYLFFFSGFLIFLLIFFYFTRHFCMNSMILLSVSKESSEKNKVLFHFIVNLIFLAISLHTQKSSEGKGRCQSCKLFTAETAPINNWKMNESYCVTLNLPSSTKKPHTLFWKMVIIWGGLDNFNQTN